MADRVRWGIAGTGGIAEAFVRDALRLPDADVVAVASRSAERAATFADRLGIARRHGSYEALAADDGVDVVYVATPHSRHEPDTLLFLAAGRHVLCEKPFALDRRQAERMVAAAGEAGVFLMEAMWSRSLPAYVELRALLEAGRIGTPVMVEADFGFAVPVDPAHRLFDRTLGGGALLDLGVYPVQLSSLVLGTPDRVAAFGRLGETGVDEHVAALLHHDGDRLGVVKAAIRLAMSCRARVSGTDGWIDLPPFMHRPDHLVVGGPDGRERIERPAEGGGLQYQVAEVHRCLGAGLVESPVMPLAESCSIMGTLDAIRAEIGLTYPGGSPPADG